MYLRWAYSHRIVVSRESGRASGRRNYSSILCRTYVLGDILLDSDFKDAVLDVLSQYCVGYGDWIPHDEARYIYGNTRGAAPLRTWLVTCSVTYRAVGSPISKLKKFEEYHCLEYYRDCWAFSNRLLCVLHGRIVKLDDAPEDVFVTCLQSNTKNCLLHGHGEERECYRSKYGK